MSANRLPLVVDLDGTLIRTDLLHEAASRHLAHSPYGIFQILGWLRSGKAHVKHELAERSDLDHAHLPFRTEVLDWLTEERAKGRHLVLATAASRTVAQPVADALGIFDEVLASDADHNLKGQAKRDTLVTRYGEHGFDYVGDTRSDLAVWSSAHVAHVVGDRSLVTRASKVAEVGKIFEKKSRSAMDLFRAMRPHQWVKNLLIILPLMTAQKYDHWHAIGASLLALLAFSIAASSVYVLNDIADVANDRVHPTKRNRPFASGRASLVAGWLLWPVLAVLSVALAALVNWLFLATLLGYLVLTTLYTFWGKRQPVIDVVSLGMLYTVRIIAGAAAIQAELSTWLLNFSFLFFLSLALIKRVSELTRARATTSEAKGRGYRNTDLELLSSYGVASSIGAVVIFALYVNDPLTATLYQSPEALWATVPILLAWLMRAWLVAHRGEMLEDPILFAMRDRVSIVAGLLVLAVFAVARIGFS